MKTGCWNRQPIDRCYVYILPLRNENHSGEDLTIIFSPPVYILPLRNENPEAEQNQEYLIRVYILPLRNENILGGIPQDVHLNTFISYL